MGNVILIVDDSEDTRELFQATLEAEGYSVVEAKDGPHALELLRHYPGKISLILLDVTMPGMSGLDVLKEMTRLSVPLVASGQVDQF